MRCNDNYAAYVKQMMPLWYVLSGFCERESSFFNLNRTIRRGIVVLTC
jgi:hypothetical protein